MTMSDDDKKWGLGKIVGSVTAVLVALALVLWGVPYYLSYEVRAAVAQELADKSLPDDVGKNKQTLSDMQAQLATLNSQVASMNELIGRLDDKMEKRDQALMEYLERQAHGND